MNMPERPNRKPDFCIDEYGLCFWWAERIVETVDILTDVRFYLNPDNWTCYQKEGELFDISLYVLEKYKAEMNESYASWLLEEELCHQ